MRLAQLARKLAIRPTEIVEFLTDRNIQIGDESNTRLEDDHVALIMQKFAPARAAEVAAELVIEKEEAIKVNLREEAKVLQPLTEEQLTVEPSTSVSEFQSEKPEVIKAPKVELSGLKVLGKIELPESRKKEAQGQPEEVKGDLAEKQETLTEPTHRSQEKRKDDNRKHFQNKREPAFRSKINPIAIQREREAFEAEKKRRAQAKEEKEKRTQHYLKKVKASGPTKSIKLVKEEVEEMPPLAPIPKTWWGRFLRWLNT